MLDRMSTGVVAPKPHTRFRSREGALYYEECVTREGFDGPFSILYHEHRPHEAQPIATTARFPVPGLGPSSEPGFMRRHYRALELPRSASTLLASRVPLLFNEYLTLGFARPTLSDTVYFANADADELFFVLRGQGTLRSPFGDVPIRANDYLYVPKGTLYRFILPEDSDSALLTLELRRGAMIPARYRNGVGQLRLDAPYSHRDFVRPALHGPRDEGIRDQVVKRGGAFYGYRSEHSPLDVVGWDGSVYPFAFPVLAFQPKVGQIHLPPPVHTTFEAEGAIICSFVPRLLDFHEQANPCPYPHSSVDMDEVLFYANGAFGSRRGIGVGSLSHHPAGIPHGPHPGAYENAQASGRTEELAVMIDTRAPLMRTEYAVGIEDTGYHASFTLAQ